MTVRSVVASLAAALGMSVDDIDDLRLGVNEAVSLLTDVGEAVGADDARLLVQFDTEPGQITVSASRSGIGDVLAEVDLLASRILDAVVDDFSIGDDGRLVLVKRVPTDVDA